MDTTTTVLSIMLVIGIFFGLYNSPSPETLLMLVAGVSFLLYGYGRYWRNPQGFRN
jgi:hypothetical protein